MNIELKLTSITPGGDAMGRHAGMVVFVPLGLPGETVEVEIVEQRRTFARGRIVRVLQAVPERVSPRCRHFGRCGGCQWQQIDYAAQLRFKTEIVREQLTRIGKLENPPVLTCIPSADAYHYRNHARLAVAPSGRFGYRALASHTIVEVEECPILEEVLESQVVNQQHQGSLDQTRPNTKQNSKQKEQEFRWSTPTLSVGEDDYFVSPQSFFQANTPIAAKMVNWVMEALQLTGNEAVLDLYCGVGLFTLPMARRAAQVIGIESNPFATADAERNLATIRQQRPGAVKLISAPVAVALQQSTITSKQWDALVLDPPRIGVDEQALQCIIALDVPLLLYVSCDPATLARDIHELVNAGYQLVSAQPFDLFPQTYHVETCCILRKTRTSLP